MQFGIVVIYWLLSYAKKIPVLMKVNQTTGRFQMNRTQSKLKAQIFATKGKGGMNR